MLILQSLKNTRMFIKYLQKIVQKLLKKIIFLKNVIINITI